MQKIKILDTYKGQTALVTGASRGIGRSIALSLAGAGMKVAVFARNSGDLDSLTAEIRKKGGVAEAFPGDITKEKQIKLLFESVKTTLGSPGVLINNAGTGIYGPLPDYASTDLDHLIAVNLRGTFLCSREAMRGMIPMQRGYIINIASVVGFRGYPNQSAYTATKHGVVGMTKALAKEAQEYGIRVSVINPGGVDTDMVRRSRPDLDPAVLLKPADVSHTVLFLLSLSEQAAIDEIYLRRKASTPF